MLAPNHYSEADPLAVALAVWKAGRAPRFMAKESLFRVPVLGWILRITGMVPGRALVVRGIRSPDARDVRDARRGSAAGSSSTPRARSRATPDLWPMRGKTGAVRLALADDIPLIPMAQWGVPGGAPALRQAQALAAAPPGARPVRRPVDLAAFRANQSQPAALVERDRRGDGRHREAALAAARRARARDALEPGRSRPEGDGSP